MDQVIAFATLFLGLVVGPQEVEVLVGPEVAGVAIALDDQDCQPSDKSPWIAVCDFGSWPEPRHLVGRALDDSGGELGRVERWVNVPGSPAEVSLVIDRSRGPQESVARLSWQSLSSSSPRRALVTLDGEPVEVLDPREVLLPPYDPASAHLLRAELEFADESTAQAEVVFGGFFMDSVQTELNAHLVLLSGRAEPDPNEVSVQARLDSRSIRVAAVEKGPADLLIVRSREAVPRLREILGREARSMRTSNKSLSNLSTEGRLKTLVPLADGVRARFVWPYELEDERDAFRLFGTSDELTQVDGGLLWLLSQMSHEGGQLQSLADAVAVAGMNAVRHNRRRAVLVVISGQDSEDGQLDAAQARHYLRSINAPLFVWSVGSAQEAGRSDGGQDWGEIVSVSSVSRMRKAGRDLSRQLARQRLVWVESGMRARDLEIVGDSLERLTTPD